MSELVVLRAGGQAAWPDMARPNNLWFVTWFIGISISSSAKERKMKQLLTGECLFCVNPFHRLLDASLRSLQKFSILIAIPILQKGCRTRNCSSSQHDKLRRSSPKVRVPNLSLRLLFPERPSERVMSCAWGGVCCWLSPQESACSHWTAQYEISCKIMGSMTFQ